MNLSAISFPEWDKELFIYLNSKNHPWFDTIMVILSSHTFWTMICLTIVIFLIWKNRKQGLTASFFLVGGVITDLILNNIIKIFFMRPRPGHELGLKDFIIQLEEVGNSYSFFSAHSSSSMCLALFTTLYFKNKTYGICMFLWATAVAYSRIYVGKHYPLDVIVGILFGLLMGWITFWFYKKHLSKK